MNTRTHEHISQHVNTQKPEHTNPPPHFLQHMYIPPKLIFGLAVACADKVQRDMHVRGLAGLGGV
jgi:hypothetical protein